MSAIPTRRRAFLTAEEKRTLPAYIVGASQQRITKRKYIRARSKNIESVPFEKMPARRLEMCRHSPKVYLIKAAGMKRYKIGFTDNTPWTRLEVLQIGSPVDLQLIGCVEGSPKLEAKLHRFLAVYSARGEWFELPNSIAIWLFGYFGAMPKDVAASLSRACIKDRLSESVNLDHLFKIYAHKHK